MMNYFSYGSNMSVKRLRSRIPTARPLGRAVLREHMLEFHKVGHGDGTAKCDALHTGDTEHSVIGVVFEICEASKQTLDAIEGLGCGYEQKTVSVELQDGNIIQAYTYYATHIDPALKPLHWYKEHVLRGAREHNLPDDYILQIEAVESLADPDAGRHERELAIYIPR